MPRPNKPRQMTHEANLAKRIQHEREQRGMSYEGVASRMTLVGCPIQASAIYKIEKADPPRRITVDELVAFAQVFELDVKDLLLPPEIALEAELRELVAAHEDALREWRPLWRRVIETKAALYERVRDDEAAQEVLRPILAASTDEGGEKYAELVMNEIKWSQRAMAQRKASE